MRCCGPNLGSTMSLNSQTIRLVHQSGTELNAEVTAGGLVVGRSQQNSDVPCPWDTRMSRRHGRLWIENDQVWYEDLGSSNGSWINKARIDHRIALEIHHLVLLGETTLSLVQETEEMTVSDGMTVQAGQRVSREDFAGALKEASEKSDLLRTLAQFVDKLLGAATLSEIAPCLRSLYSHLPTAQHIYLIGPLQEDGSFQH